MSSYSEALYLAKRIIEQGKSLRVARIELRVDPCAKNALYVTAVANEQAGMLRALASAAGQAAVEVGGLDEDVLKYMDRKQKPE